MPKKHKKRRKVFTWFYSQLIFITNEMIIRVEFPSQEKIYLPKNPLWSEVIVTFYRKFPQTLQLLVESRKIKKKINKCLWRLHNKILKVEERIRK